MTSLHSEIPEYTIASSPERNDIPQNTEIDFGGEKESIIPQAELAFFEMGSRMQSLAEKLQKALESVTNPEKKQQILDLLQKVQAFSTPQKTLGAVEKKAQEMPEYVSRVDELEEGYKKETSGILDSIGEAFSGLEKYLDPKMLFLSPLLFAFETVREHPVLIMVLLLTFFASTVGIGPTLNAILAGGGAIWEQIVTVAKYFGIDELIEEWIKTALTYMGMGAASGYAAGKVGKVVAKKGVKIAGNAAKSALKKGVEAAGTAVAEKSSVGIATRLFAFVRNLNLPGLLLMPGNMGNGDMTPELWEKYQKQAAQ